jgi:hypothetical protein
LEPAVLPPWPAEAVALAVEDVMVISRIIVHNVGPKRICGQADAHSDKKADEGETSLLERKSICSAEDERECFKKRYSIPRRMAENVPNASTSGQI